MRIAALLVTAGIALIVWLKLTRHVQDAPRWKPADRTAWDDAAAAYEESVTYSRDAVEWLADCAAEIPDDVMATIVAMYRESARFATVVDDMLFEAEQQ